LPIGTLKTNIKDLIVEAGISEQLLEITADTIYVVYGGSMSMKPTSPIPGLGYGDNIINYIPNGVQFAFDGGSADIDIDVFKDLSSSGSVLYPSNPQIYLTMHNYIGADINVDVHEIKSYGNGEKNAVFSNGETSYSINVGSAVTAGESVSHTEVLDKTNGRIHDLFSNSPERISYDFGVNLQTPDDGKPHFIVNGKYVDLEYKIKIPMTFSAGTRLSSADTLDLDLSGEAFINNIDELILWINFENRVHATIDLELVFLNEYKNVIPSINRKFHINASPAEGTHTLKFNKTEFDDAKQTKYILLKTILKVDAGSGEVNIHPSDFITFKLSAYSKVSINNI
jgi:hypothetical protein